MSTHFTRRSSALVQEDTAYVLKEYGLRPGKYLQ